MKHLSFILGIFILLALINAEDKQFGKDLTLKEKTDVAAILQTPAEFVGKRVQIEGTIINVCETRGCWIDIAAAEGYDKIRVKVNDGEIVFPMEAKGKTAVVEGEVYTVTPANSCSGNCSEASKSEEVHQCPHEKEPAKIYQIKGSGAVIKL